MLFNSFEYLFFFFPSVLLLVYALRRAGSFVLAEIAMIAASLGFYAWWDWRFLSLLLGSAVFNWQCGKAIAGSPKDASRFWLVFGVTLGLSVLAFFKYGSFLRDAATFHLNANSSVYVWILPLGISFWTFEQIIYLVECYRGHQQPLDFKRYLLFVSFFPRLIAGPIVRPSDFFNANAQWRRPIDPEMIAAGVSLLAIGLFKKVCLADRISPIINPIYALADGGTLVTPADSFVAAVGFALQIYFDFSGYSDIAIGTALMLGIRLPPNFDAPYRSTSIVVFWRRWHMSLSGFLRDYLYVPLGGNRHGRFREACNILATMTLGGLWHGAGVNFLIWGLLHGAFANIAHVGRAVMRGRRGQLLRIGSWASTLYAVLIAWAYFRANTLNGATQIVSGLLFPLRAIALLRHRVWPVWHCMLLPSSARLFRAFILSTPSSPLPDVGVRWQPTVPWAILCACLLTAAVWLMLGGKREFIYFHF